MRKGRYKKNLLTESECLAFATQFNPFVQDLTHALLQDQISEVQFVAEYFFCALRQIKGANWKGSRLTPGQAQSALEIFEIFSLRGIPLSANRSLIAWSQKKYKLKLFFDVPNIETVLKLQCQGIRCVTCLTKPEQLCQYVLGERDPISFTLHDLIHADHFLRDPHQRQVQIGFSRWMLELWQHPQIQKQGSHDLSFLSGFEYACADMNSHGAHLVKYLKAIFCQAEIQELLLQSTVEAQFSPNFLQALKYLNTPAETSEHLSRLQTELFLKGSTSSQYQEDDSIAFRKLSAV